MHGMRTIAIDDPVAWASVSRSLIRGFVVQTRLNGSRSCLGWRLSDAQKLQCIWWGSVPFTTRWQILLHCTTQEPVWSGEGLEAHYLIWGLNHPVAREGAFDAAFAQLLWPLVVTTIYGALNFRCRFIQIRGPLHERLIHGSFRNIEAIQGVDFLLQLERSKFFGIGPKRRSTRGSDVTMTFV